MHYWSRSFIPHRSYVLVTIQRHLRPAPWDWYCVLCDVAGSAGPSTLQEFASLHELSISGWTGVQLHVQCLQMFFKNVRSGYPLGGNLHNNITNITNCHILLTHDVALAMPVCQVPKCIFSHICHTLTVMSSLSHCYRAVVHSHCAVVHSHSGICCHIWNTAIGYSRHLHNGRFPL